MVAPVSGQSVTITSGAQVTLDVNADVDDLGLLVGATLNTKSGVSLSGVDLISGGTVNLSSGGAFQFSGSIYNNFLNLSGGTTLTANAVDSDFDFTADGGSTVTVAQSVYNYGYFETGSSGGHNTVTVNGVFDNLTNYYSPQLNLAGSGDLMSVASLYNTGTVSVASGATLNITGSVGIVSIPSTASYNISGSFNLTGGSQKGSSAFASLSSVAGGLFLVNGQTCGTGSFANTGFVSLGNGTTMNITGNLTNSGIFQTEYPNDTGNNTLNISGTLTNLYNSSGYDITVNGSGDVLNTNALVNQGIIAISPGAAVNITGGGAGVTDVVANSNFVVAGDFYVVNGNSKTSALANLASVEGSLYIANGKTLTVGPITNTGTLMVQDGTTLNVMGNVTSGGSFGTSYANFAGASTAGSAVVVTGTFTNTGTVSAGYAGDLVNFNGLTNQGMVTVSPGATLGIGNGVFSSRNAYEQLAGSTLTEVITPGGGFGTIAVQGAASLAGTLKVNFTGTGAVPLLSTGAYTVLSATSITGTFNNGSALLPAGSGFLKVTYNPTSVTVQPTDVITFYDIYAGPNLTDTGHVFLTMTDLAGDTTYYGFYPLYFPPLYCNGIVSGNDINSPWNFKIAYPVSGSAYNAAASLIYTYSHPFPKYSLLTFNCTNFAAAIAAAAGIQLPNYRDALGIADPRAFGDSLIGIGNGNPSQGGGTVTFNQASPSLEAIRPAASPQGTAPYDYSYDAITSLGHTDPATLASDLQVPLDQADLGPVNANSQSGLSVTVENADPTLDVISINWGDGSAYEGQSLSFSHVYAPGAYTADVLDVDQGAVHSYDFEVTVSSAPGSSVMADFATLPPVENPNTGFIPETPVPGVPEPAAGMAFLASALATVAGRAGRRRPTGLH